MAFVARGNDSRPDLVADLARGSIDPLYALHGAERYLVDRCLAAIRRAVTARIPPAFAAFNIDSFDLAESTMSAVIGTARTLPMMAPMRLVVARGVDAVKADALGPLATYARDPNPSACLVLVGDKIDTRWKAFQIVKKAGYLHEMAPLRERELAGWLAAEARARNIAIRPDAASALADAIGPDLGTLAQSLEQLALFADEGQTITVADVDALIAPSRQRGVFELTKAIAEGQVTRALAILANMFHHREPALRVQFMLARQLRQIWKAKSLLAAGMRRDQIAGAVGIPPFFVDDILVPARRMSEETLSRGLERLFQADRALKSSRVDGEILLSRLVQEIARGAAGSGGEAGPGGGRTRAFSPPSSAAAVRSSDRAPGSAPGRGGAAST